MLYKPASVDQVRCLLQVLAAAPRLLRQLCPLWLRLAWERAWGLAGQCECDLIGCFVFAAGRRFTVQGLEGRLAGLYDESLSDPSDSSRTEIPDDLFSVYRNMTKEVGFKVYFCTFWGTEGGWRIGGGIDTVGKLDSKLFPLRKKKWRKKGFFLWRLLWGFRIWWSTVKLNILF